MLCFLRGRRGGIEVEVTWTPKVCRIIAFSLFWAIILPTFGVWVGVSGLRMLDSGFKETPKLI